MHLPEDFMVLLAIASIPLLAVALFYGWRHRGWASPWPGVGEDIDSFEDLLAALQLIAAPAAFAALLILSGFLGYRFWQGTLFDPPKPSPCACPSAGKTDRPACIPACRDTPIDGDLGAAFKELTKAVNGVAEKLDGNGSREMARTLLAIETTLTAIAGSMTKTGPTAADLLDRLDKLQAGLHEVAEAVSKPVPTTPQWTERLDGIEKALRAIAVSSAKSGSAAADLLDRLDTLQAGLRSLAAAAGKPAPVAPPELLERLDGIERALRAIPASPGKPGPAAPDLLDRLDKLQAALRPLAEAPELLKRLDAIEKALRQIAENGPVPPILVTSQIEAILKVLTDIQISVGKLDGGAGPNAVIEHLTLIEAILSALPYPSPAPCGPVPGFAPLAEPTESERR
jgi:hypothetical protein